MTSENPYSPPLAESNQPIRELRPRSAWVRGFYSLQLLVLTIGFAAAIFIDTETIIATGLALVLVGLVLLGLAWRYKDLPFMTCGFSGPMFGGVIFLLIFLNDWGPEEARWPVLGLASVYMLWLVSVGVGLWLHRRGSLPNKVE